MQKLFRCSSQSSICFQTAIFFIVIRFHFACSHSRALHPFLFFFLFLCSWCVCFYSCSNFTRKLLNNFDRHFVLFYFHFCIFLLVPYYFHFFGALSVIVVVIILLFPSSRHHKLFNMRKRIFVVDLHGSSSFREQVNE